MGCKNICIKIPQELKDEFQRDKHLLNKLKFFSVEKIEQALIDNNITVVLTEIKKCQVFILWLC